MTSAHWDSVGVGFGMALAGVTGKKAQAAAEGTVIVFAPFVVTVPPNASALPFSCEASPSVTPAASRMLPTKVDAPPSVVAPTAVQ